MIRQQQEVKMSTLEAFKEQQTINRIRAWITKYPNSDVSIAYRMGRKDKEIELQPAIDQARKGR